MRSYNTNTHYKLQILICDLYRRTVHARIPDRWHREQFRQEQFREPFEKFITKCGFDIHYGIGNDLLKIFNEITLNIYDHTITGRGRLHFSFDHLSQIFRFMAYDLDAVRYEPTALAVIPYPSTKLGNGVNSGMGLQTIVGKIAVLQQNKQLLSFGCTTDRGFRYTGSVQMK